VERLRGLKTAQRRGEKWTGKTPGETPRPPGFKKGIEGPTKRPLKKGFLGERWKPSPFPRDPPLFKLPKGYQPKQPLSNQGERTPSS